MSVTDETAVDRTFKVTYKLRGGTNSSSNKTSYEDSELPVTFDSPVNEGYVFKGWFTDEDYTESIKKITAEFPKNPGVFEEGQKQRISRDGEDPLDNESPK